jgi:thioredoxin 1
MPMVNVTSAEFEAKVLNNELPVLLDFGAVWCAPCKTLEPMVDQLADQYAGRLFVGHVDVGEQPDIAAKYGILGVPSLLFLNKGAVVKQLAGVPSKGKLVTTIEDVLAETGT